MALRTEPLRAPAPPAGQAPVLLWSTDRRHRCTLWFAAGLAAAVPRGDEAGTVAAHRRALAGEAVSYELEWGDQAFRAHVRPVRDRRGRVSGSVGVAIGASGEQTPAAAREEAIHQLARAAEFRDVQTAMHVERMSSYCALIARRLGLDGERVESIRRASRMHDIGKLAVPHRILLKAGPLNTSERSLMEQHASIGHAILAGTGVAVLELAGTIAGTHHERFNGFGYPRRLKGDAIPPEGRIAAVADVFDALSSPRPYRPPMPVDKTIRIMRTARGSHFDPAILDLLLDSLDEALAIKRMTAAPAILPDDARRLTSV